MDNTGLVVTITSGDGEFTVRASKDGREAETHFSSYVWTSVQDALRIVEFYLRYGPPADPGVK